MPAEVNQPVITINGPLGLRSINNPLYNYTFRPQPSAVEFPPSSSVSQTHAVNRASYHFGPPFRSRILNICQLASFHSTVRYPNSAGQSQPDLANKQLQANGASLHSSTYQLITQQSNYAPFSNTGYTDARGNHYNSIENMHNAIHSLVGNGGHMAVVPYSAFDPIFWLHHANVDRLFAIWQAIYPSSFVTSQISNYGTYTNTPGKSEDINTLLTPFHSDDSGALHTSLTARSTRSFGYTYPEIVDWGVNATQLTANVKARLNALYNPSSSFGRRSTTSDRGSNRGSGGRRFPNGMNRQWFINIRMDKSAVTSSFFVHFFLGSVPVDPTGWSFAPNLVGTHSVLDATIFTAANTGPATALYGQIPLNHALLDSGIHHLGPQSVVPFLTSRLNWRLQRMDDSPLDVSEVPSLKIYVVGQRVKPRVAEDAFPEYEKLVAYRSVTRGKAGALADGDPE
ncbi:MAG: hypothetical protein Q9167_005724 [Letrouitia subvulpina]